jgi:hypothetical protein
MLDAAEDSPSPPCLCLECDDQGKTTSESRSARLCLRAEHILHRNAARAAMIATPAMTTRVTMMTLPARSVAAPCDVALVDGMDELETEGDAN